MSNPVPDWQLPHGVSRNLWDTLHDPDVANRYDAELGDSPLLAMDQQFVREHCRPPGRLADLGCGTGRLCLTLASQGYEPVGIDLSPEMLRVLRQKCENAGVHIATLQASLTDLSLFPDASFNAAACLFSTLGLLQGKGARRQAVSEAHRILKPGGVYVLHAHNKWFLLGTRAGRRMLARNMVGSWLRQQVAGDFVMPARLGSGTLTMHLFTRRELTRMLQAAGFDIQAVLPVSVSGPLRKAWWLGRLRAYGYLIAARKREPSPR